MATNQLQPMSVGEILDAALNLMRSNFSVLIAIVVACQGVQAVLGVYVEQAGGAREHPLLYVVTQILTYIGYLLTTGATVYVVSESLLGRQPTFAQALAFARRKMGRIFFSGLAAGLVTVLAFLLLIIPGIVVACGFAVTVQAAVLEDLPDATSALGRSWDLTKGYKGKALTLGFVMFVLLFLVVLGLGLALGIVAAFIKFLTVPALIAVALLSLLIYPLMSCTFTLLYYDLRVRKEAFDLELLSQHLGALAAGG